MHLDLVEPQDEECDDFCYIVIVTSTGVCSMVCRAKALSIPSKLYDYSSLESIAPLQGRCPLGHTVPDYQNLIWHRTSLDARPATSSKQAQQFLESKRCVLSGLIRHFSSLNLVHGVGLVSTALATLPFECCLPE